MNAVEKQYKNADNLNIRISIHQKYSVNQQPFGEWIMEHYEIRPGFRILELGCGTADMWKGKGHLIKDQVELVLTDLSPGMLTAARENTADFSGVRYQIVDIQDIPYPENTFDMVIANMMLYHVPNLQKGLSEVRRVLKSGGKFYCATYGQHGIMEFVNETLHEYNIEGRIGDRFLLQNGGEILSTWFSKVERYDREDGLAVTNVRDFVSYVKSLTNLIGLDVVDAETLQLAFEKKTSDGVLFVPKQYGMFVCIK